jgi:hypothetical protein
LGGSQKYVSIAFTFEPVRAGGIFFADTMPNHWRLGFENGNSLSICSLLAKNVCVLPKDSAAFA